MNIIYSGGDSPNPPPFQLFSGLPNLVGAVSDGSVCGAHQHDNSMMGPARARGNDPFNVSLFTCGWCLVAHPLQETHPLDCGHVLCRVCLNTVASEARNVAGRAWTRMVYPALTRMREFRRLAREGEQLGETAKARECERAEAGERLAAYVAAGMTCCGKPMKLERFLPCMEPKVAAAYSLLWLSLTMVAPEQVYICGWPDCLQPVPDLQEDLGHTGLGFWGSRYGHNPILYCLNCEANSQFGSHLQALVPAG